MQGLVTGMKRGYTFQNDRNGAFIAMVSRMLTPEFRAAQLAGSSRLEGIRVSSDDEKLMASIIRGDVQPTDLIRKLQAEYASNLRR